MWIIYVGNRTLTYKAPTNLSCNKYLVLTIKDVTSNVGSGIAWWINYGLFPWCEELLSCSQQLWTIRVHINHFVELNHTTMRNTFSLLWRLNRYCDLLRIDENVLLSIWFEMTFKTQKGDRKVQNPYLCTVRWWITK